MLRILTYLVDDDLLIRKAIGDVLDMADVEYKPFESANAAKRAATMDKVDILIIDATLSSYSTGKDVIMDIRAMYPELFVILITANQDPKLLQEYVNITGGIQRLCFKDDKSFREDLLAFVKEQIYFLHRGEQKCIAEDERVVLLEAEIARLKKNNFTGVLSFLKSGALFLRKLF